LASEPIDNIVVLDNGSESNERIAARNIVSSIEKARFLDEGQKLCFGGGMNEIATSTAATAENGIIWLLNPDCEVQPGATSKLVQALDTYDIVSPLITSGSANDGKVWFAGGVLEPSKGACSHVGYGRSPEEFSDEASRPSMFLSGASLVMQRSTWDVLGGFREDLFLYWEDAELCLRAAGLNMTLGVVPQARVWHREGGSSVNDGSLRSKTYYYYITRNRIIVCSTKAAKYDIVLIRGFVESLKLLARPLLREKSGRLGKFFAAVRGTFDGIMA
jgi:GT2 family glycosyltransferase